MAGYFLDSSALVKRYHWESGSDRVYDLFNSSANRLFISRLALVEIHSSFVRLVREGILSAPDFGKLIERLEGDAASGVLNVVALSNRRLEGACSLLSSHGFATAIRTLDAIQLATAEALNRRSVVGALVAADQRLLAAAKEACGLPVLDVG